MKKLTKVLSVILVLSLTFILTSCTSKMDKINAEKQAAIVGAWILADGSDVGQDENGETYVNVYEFTADGRQNYHQVANSQTTTYPQTKYEIYDGKLKVFTETGAKMAAITFKDDLMTMGTGSEQNLYRKLTEDELKTYNIKLGTDPAKTIDEAEQTNSDSSVSETGAGSETVSETVSESVSE